MHSRIIQGLFQRCELEQLHVLVILADVHYSVALATIFLGSDHLLGLSQIGAFSSCSVQTHPSSSIDHACRLQAYPCRRTWDLSSHLFRLVLLVFLAILASMFLRGVSCFAALQTMSLISLGIFNHGHQNSVSICLTCCRLVELLYRNVHLVPS